jgi:predicted nucleotidyltransferase
MTLTAERISPVGQPDVTSAAAEGWLRRLRAALRTSSLTETEQRAVAEFLAALQTHDASAVDAVIFYGSAARGEVRVESDVDLLLVARRSLSQTEQKALRDLGDQAGWNHGVILSVLVMPLAEQAWHSRGSSLWRNIQREGLLLWPTPQTPLRLDAGFRYKKNPASGSYTMTEPQYDEILTYLQHSDEELAGAEVLSQSGMERLAILRCYYAIFYATTALLLYNWPGNLDHMLR